MEEKSLLQLSFDVIAFKMHTGIKQEPFIVFAYACTFILAYKRTFLMFSGAFLVSIYEPGNVQLMTGNH